MSTVNTTPTFCLESIPGLQVQEGETQRTQRPRWGEEFRGQEAEVDGSCRVEFWKGVIYIEKDLQKSVYVLPCVLPG